MELNYHFQVECFNVIGVDHKLHDLYSLRSGGAASAVSYNSNPLEQVLKLHGRWKFDT